MTAGAKSGCRGSDDDLGKSGASAEGREGFGAIGGRSWTQSCGADSGRGNVPFGTLIERLASTVGNLRIVWHAL